MKSRLHNAALVFVLASFSLSCARQQPNDRTSEPNHSDEIPELKLDKFVRFRAIIRKQTGVPRCTELFRPEDFEKYHGDGKLAIPANTAEGDTLPDKFEQPTEVVVSGELKWVHDSDPLENCGVITGEVFMITSIETP